MRTSTDQGTTWLPHLSLHDSSSPHPGSARMLDDRSEDETLYVLQEELGLFRSTDGGSTWNAYGPPDRTGFGALVQKPLSGHVVISGRSPEPRVLKSTDRGETWLEGHPLPFDDRDEVLQDLSYTPNATLVLLSTERRASGPGRGWYSWLYRSRDDGESWSEGVLLESNPAPDAYARSSGELHLDEVTLYALIGGRHVTEYRSTDNGENWSEANMLYRETDSVGAGGVVALSAGLLSNDVLAAWDQGFELGTPEPGQGLNIHYQVVNDSLWIAPRRMNNQYGSVHQFADLTCAGDDMVALWSDTRYHGAMDPEVVASRSNDEANKNYGVVVDESTLPLQLKRGDDFALRYTATDWACPAESVADVWLNLRGENGITRMLHLERNVQFPCEEPLEFRFEHHVPPATPLQSYTITAHVGFYPDEALDRDIFSVAIVP